MYQKKNWSTEHSTRNRTVPGKVAKTCTKDGHKQTTKNKHYNINQKDEETQDDRGRWSDQLHLEDQGTGNMPNPSGT